MTHDTADNLKDDAPTTGGGLAARLRVPKLRLLGADTISSAQQWQLLDELFRLSSPLIAGAVVRLLGFFGWEGDVRSEWWGLAMVSNLAVCAYRVLLTLAFRRRSGDSSADVWVRRLGTGIVVTGCQWGGSLAVLYAEGGPSTRLSVLACACGFMSGAVSRAFIFPAATAAQIVITTSAVMVPLVASGNALYATLLALFVVAHLSLMQGLCASKLRLMAADVERDNLLGLLRAANAELAVANARLEDRASTDGLTGVANRRNFDERLADLEAHADWHTQPHSVVMMDVDRFKVFNDTHGHGAGDRCLALIARAAGAHVTAPGQLLARYGGEEFAILLPRTPLADAAALAETIRAAVACVRVATREGDAAPTASFGVAATIPGWREPAFGWVDRADQALYRAKQAGRDCVRTAAMPVEWGVAHV